MIVEEGELLQSSQKKVLELSRQVPLDTLGRLVEAVQGGINPHPLLLTCSKLEQYDSLAQLVELLASLPPELRLEVLEDVYIRVKLVHNREKV